MKVLIGLSMAAVVGTLAFVAGCEALKNGATAGAAAGAAGTAPPSAPGGTSPLEVIAYAVAADLTWALAGAARRKLQGPTDGKPDA